MNQNSKILILGKNGLAGSAIFRELEKKGFKNILAPSSTELNLVMQQDVFKYFEVVKPEYVFFAAGKVGGIMANKTYPGEFIYLNSLMIANTIEASRINAVKKFLYLGSSCIYPKNSPQPIKEEYLLSDYIDDSNLPYAISKISGITMCQAYRKQYDLDAICLMPTNLFGIGDNYDKFNSHLVAALISKIHFAKINNEPVLTLWGSGKPRREILFSDHLGEAAVYFMINYSSDKIVNIGLGEDYSICELANLVKGIIGYNGDIKFDTSFPDGVMEKKLDVSYATSCGWTANYNLKNELQLTYNNYIKTLNK